MIIDEPPSPLSSTGSGSITIAGYSVGTSSKALAFSGASYGI